MVQVGIISIQLLSLIPFPGGLLPDLVMLLIGAACAFLLAYLLTFAVKAFCYKVGWLDRPASRRVHIRAVPRLGGIAMFLAFVIAS